jgi:hypothetical protein
VHKLEFAGCAASPAIRSQLQRFRACLPSNYADIRHLRVSSTARAMLHELICLLRTEDGVALYPTQWPMNNVHADLFWEFHDAARPRDGLKREGKFHGYCSWLWQHGSNQVHFFVGEWRAREMILLHSSPLEFANVTFCACPDWGDGRTSFEDIIEAHDNALAEPRRPSELISVCDNRSCAQGTANSGKATAAAMRFLECRRTAALLRTGRRTASYHCKRFYNQAADAGSKGAIDLFKQEVSQYLCIPLADLNFTRLAGPSGRTRDLDDVLKAAKRSTEGSTNERQ